MKKTNVLHIIDTLGIGGAEKVMVGVVNGLPDFNHHVVYLNGSDALSSRLPKDCKVLKLGYRSKLDFISCVLKLRWYIRKNDIKVVHSHLFLATLIARVACPKKVKLYTTIHSLPSKNYFAESRIARLLEKLTYRSRHGIIAICKEVFADYNKCIGIKGPYTILYNYVDDRFRAATYKKATHSGELHLVAVGNLRKAKNYPYLIETFKKLPSNIHLDIYGSGPLKAGLQQEIEKHRLNIRLCGVREDIQHVLPAYDAFIMSSIFEGQPISLLEAMACGMPAILSDIPVLQEVTDNRAIFYDLSNTDDLVEKLNKIARHEIDLEVFAKANFERVKAIASRDNYMEVIRKLYNTTGTETQRLLLVPAPKVSLPVMTHR